jgi:hypothetical protein
MMKTKEKMEEVSNDDDDDDVAIVIFFYIASFSFVVSSNPAFENRESRACVRPFVLPRLLSVPNVSPKIHHGGVLSS